MTHSILFVAILLASVALTGKDSRPFAAEPGSAGGSLGKKNKSVSGGGSPAVKAKPKPVKAKTKPVKAIRKFTGRWRMNAICSTGNYIITVNITAATGSHVAGTTSSTSGFSTRILDGKVSGNTIRFRRRTSNSPFKVTDQVTGRLSSASRMTGTITGGVSTCTFTASR